MPLFTYFAVVGSLLLGLLYVAEARLGPPASLSISTSFHGLPAPFKGQRSVILTARDAPMPDMSGMNAPSSIVVHASMAQPIMARATDTKLPKTAQVKKTKKPAKVARKKAGGNRFAQSPRPGGGVIW